MDDFVLLVVDGIMWMSFFLFKRLQRFENKNPIFMSVFIIVLFSP